MSRIKYRPKISIKKVSKINSIPYQTFTDWTKSEKEGDWRGFLADKLKTYTVMEEVTIENLRTIFTTIELKVLCSSVASQKIDWELIKNGKELVHIFINYCIYEQKEVQQFADPDILSKSVSNKLSRLSIYERYCLIEYLNTV
ncbi:hypothetical protein [Aquamicrobium sp.]|uniref:hypothetical protein n=1 Tax=Aquamicrobium sp. TaxID=1872579 RepID=UPI00258C86DC|nr:hypothetical protein [Aquamicrobium sp.]MCK9549308.1 hypothetical protein [Aquamicrobium sp.]